MFNNNVNIKEIIQNVFYDIKAEAIIAEFIENGLKPDEFVAIQKGIFKRRYARDIDSADSLKLENTQNILAFYLNRDGLYDSLPEGLFHKKTAVEDRQSKKFSEDSVELKQEEKAARIFFLPFENELFYQRVNLELEERKILSRFSEKIFNDLYPELWKLHRTINREYVYRMVLLLHLAYKITGNVNLTACCLEKIIEEKVEVRQIRTTQANCAEEIGINDSKKGCLGTGVLGLDFVCGENFTTPVVEFEFLIGPLQNTKANDYLESGSLTHFLNCFYSYFMPVEFQVKTKVLVKEMNQNFRLPETCEGPVLGYETAI